MNSIATFRQVKKLVLILFVIIVILFLILILMPNKNKESPTNISKNKIAMIISSPSFENNGKIPAKFTCDGENINPELRIQNVPSGAMSLVLVVDDPDATGGKTFTHWLAWNINPRTAIIKEGSNIPGAIVGKNDSSDTAFSYAGPCPPPGKSHRYFFKLYALDIMLNLPAKSTEEFLLSYPEHIIEKAELMGNYERQAH